MNQSLALINGDKSLLALNEETIELICNVIAKGLTYQQAALAVGLSLAAINKYRRDAYILLNDPDSAKEFTTRYCNMLALFIEKLPQAEAQAELLHLETINAAAEKGDWRASAFFLKARFPDRWGESRTVKHEVIDSRDKTDPKSLTTEELEAMIDET